MNYISKLFQVFESNMNLDMDNNQDPASELLSKLKSFKAQFRQEIMPAAKDLLLTSVVTPDGDETNPHIRAIYQLDDAIANLENQLKMQTMDPLPAANMDDMMIPDDTVETLEDPMGGSDISVDAGIIGMDPSGLETFEDGLVEDEMVLQQLDWSEQPSEDDTVKIIRGEAEGLSVYIAHDADGNYAVDIACTGDSDACGFIESNEWAEIQGFLSDKGIAVADEEIKELLDISILEDTSLVQSDLEDPQIMGVQSLEDAEEAQMFGDWEYHAYDTQYEGASTLLYDSELRTVLIIKNDAEEESKYVVYGTSDFGAPALEYVTSNIEDVVAWLDLNDLPSPTQDALAALDGNIIDELDPEVNIEESVSEAKESKDAKDDDKKVELPKLPEDLKYVEDDPSISTVAEKVEPAQVTDITEPSQDKKKG